MATKKGRKNFLKRISPVLEKSSTNKDSSYRIGFSKLDMGISLTNYALNRIMTGSWDMGFRFGRTYAVYGESGSGKSLLAALALAQAQKEHDAMGFWIDTEHATDDESGRKWFNEAGVDQEEGNFIYASGKQLSDIKSLISDLAVNYRADYEDDPNGLRPLIIVVDSWNMALPGAKYEQMMKGELVGDMGQQAKQIGDVITAATHLVEGLPIMVVGILHVYDNQDPHGRRHKTTGGNKVVFTASGALLLTKKELREADVDDTRIKKHYDKVRAGLDSDTKKMKTEKRNIIGIQCLVENLKSRAAKPFEKIPMNILYPIGIDPFSGLWEQLMWEGVFQKSGGAWYVYKDPETDKEVKFMKSKFRDHARTLMKAAEKHDQYAELRKMVNHPEQIEEVEDAPVEEDDTNNQDA